jgi:hypothetical protein
MVDDSVLLTEAYLHHPCLIERGVKVGANVTFVGTEGLTTEQLDAKWEGKTILREACTVGMNCRLHPGIEIGNGAVVEENSVVMTSVPPFTVVSGNPAKHVSFITTHDEFLTEPDQNKSFLIDLPTFVDFRGALSVCDYAAVLPWTPQRQFIVHGPPESIMRGCHANQFNSEFLICVSGSVTIFSDDGKGDRRVHVLDSPTRGILFPRMNYGCQYYHSKLSVLLVLCSVPFSIEDCIADYQLFLKTVRYHEQKEKEDPRKQQLLKYKPVYLDVYQRDYKTKTFN